MSALPPVGRVVATELKPATPHQFHFWTARESPVGIGAIVRVDAPGRSVLGIVTDGFAYSDLDRPIHDVIGADGDPALAGAAPTERAEIRLYTAAVLRQIPEQPLQPVPLGTVFLAADADVSTALRMDAFLDGEAPTGIPIGVYAAGGLEAPIYLDADFLLGPEAAHLNITGVSGLATKTSAAQFLLSSIFQTFPAHRGSVAAVCFNVKGPDLCFLDQPAELSEEDRRLYARLGVAPEPFANVRYYAPYKADGVNLNTLRTNESLAGNTVPLIWGLREVLDYAEVLLNRDDVDAKAGRADRFPQGARGGARVPRHHPLRAPARSAELRRPGRFLPPDLRVPGGRRRAGRRSGAPTTWPPSARCATGWATSASAPRGWSPTMATPATCRGGSSRIAASTSWTWPASTRWCRTWSLPGWSPSCGNTWSGATWAWTTWWSSWMS